MNERRNGLEIVKGRAIACTIQLGSISSLRCQKSRIQILVQDHGCEVMFSRTIILGRQSARLRSFSYAGHLRFVTPRGCATRSPKGEAWWSQTGSNRRPHACKARALPAELWPRTRRRMLYVALIVRSPSLALRRSSLRSRGPAEPKLQSSEGWWAWEDLNFRPHAYQARALTN